MSCLFLCTKSLLQRLALLCGFSSMCYCGHWVATCEVWPERAREQANDCTNEWSHAQRGSHAKCGSHAQCGSHAHCALEESFECFVILKVEVNNSAFSITPCNSVMVKKKVCAVSGPAVEDGMSLFRSYKFFIEGDADVWFVLTETDK